MSKKVFYLFLLQGSPGLSSVVTVAGGATPTIENAFSASYSGLDYYHWKKIVIDPTAVWIIL